MSSRSSSLMRKWAAAVLAVALVGSLSEFCIGGFLSRQRSVGGVYINAEGVLDNIEVGDREKIRELRAKALLQVPGDLQKPSKLRMVSLRKLQEAIAANMKNPLPLPDEVKYMAGLQRVEYIFVYPDLKDIVLAGPAEGWKINDEGNVVGATSGRPVLQLDDLLVALRTTDAAVKEGISCSIDPTAEGVNQVKAFLKKQTTIGNPQTTIATIEKLLGPQMISVTGVPPTSRFAHVMVAADYRMKRLAMNFEQAPVKGLPSYLDLMKSSASGMQNMMPRWWLSTNYDPILKDPEGLAWELSGPGVKAMTAEDHFSDTGVRDQTQKGSPLAQKWADNMTSKYEELSAKDTIFGDLRNCMDLAVVAALITKERLAEKADMKLDLFLNAKELLIDQFSAPKQVDSKASYLKKGSNWIISASGGVQMEPMQVASKTKESDAVAPVRAKSLPAKDARWWWD